MGNKTLEKIGAAGEELVSLVYTQMGCVVVMSEDKYDQEKDMTIDGKEAEVKSQTVFRNFPCEDGTFKPAFTVDIESACGKIYHNQLDKCKKVKKLIFVGRSSKYDPVVRIHEAPPPEERKFHISRNKHDGRLVAALLIEDMKIVKEISNEKIVSYFMDDWKGKNAKSLQYS